MTTFTPATAAGTLSAVQWALAEESPLEIVGHGSKRGIGRPLQTEHTLDLSNLSGVTLYEPAELVLSAKAGTPLAEIEALLTANNQQLAFEPMDYGPLLGGQQGRGTIGGVLAANLSGPRRLKAGAARDHILGVNAVSGRGEAFKSGGRVVKNVTGYDLSKLMAGSWGTLAVATDVIFKVLPAAETETTVAIRGLLDEEATAAMALAVGSSAEISSAAHLPEGIAGRVAGGAIGGDAATLLRIEGFGPSVAYRAAAVKDLLKAAGPIDEISGEASKALWRDIRDCTPFADGAERPVWRVSMPPSEAHKMTLALRMQTPAEAFYDWQGGLVWLRMQADPEADLLRALVKKFGGGHATLVRASPSRRASLPVFEPQPPTLAALSARLKSEFDPRGILNPGRMVAGAPSAKLAEA
ncbi:glycolate oxidase subunit GlcE [Allomesorhizobium alhagi]|jgi:glycolate oxidase FAD binding subunit|uniref:FAD linked oxidase domain-containing protein n=1 Tax=Mesorhizobium alhagi CCNWXJ12-2 TaxID=1107882 RepID=H0HXY3_9HYPH|nr:glycolate oxidase subunit GlcE [Mesorhizobium alhagi]EHK54406.1 FAD linked oxidase domain-containing protein [Mesorhizobium alhagi CCNWXJ12-2]